MKLFRVLILVCLVTMITGCMGFSLGINEGTYNLSSDSNWRNIKWDTETNFSFYLNWADQSDLEFVIEKPEALLKYGSLTLGNNEQVFRFGITGNITYVEKLYFDQDSNGKITEDEEINLKILTGGKTQYQGSSINLYESYAELPLFVRYLKADGTTISKKIILLVWFMNPDRYWSDGDHSDQRIRMWYKVLTYFEGEASIKFNKKARNVKFILVDLNNNAVFNEFGKDLFLFDTNNDEQFSYINERKLMTEFFQIPPQKPQPKQKLRLSLFAYPEKIIVTNVDSNPPEPELLEPTKDDQGNAN